MNYVYLVFCLLTRRDTEFIATWTHGPAHLGQLVSPWDKFLSIKLFQWLTAWLSDDKFVNRGAQDKAELTPSALRVCCRPAEWSGTCQPSKVMCEVMGVGKSTWRAFGLYTCSCASALGLPPPSRKPLSLSPLTDSTHASFHLRNKCLWLTNTFSWMHRRFWLLPSPQIR